MPHDIAAIPVIETERLLLRPLVFADWPAYFAFLASDRARYMGGPHTEETAWSFFCNDVAQWSLFGHGALMFEDRQTGETMGQAPVSQRFRRRSIAPVNVFQNFNGRSQTSAKSHVTPLPVTRMAHS